MRELLRRILWLIPTVVFVTALAFASLSRTLSPAEASPGLRELPLFFNFAPRGVREITWSAAETVASRGPGAVRAADLLVSIGGAGLPHLLPRLDGLAPGGRAEVAQALIPVAVRMGILREGTLQSEAEALQFWTRFSEERLIDFQAATAKRVVARFAERSTALRAKELQELDTFALDEVLRQLSHQLENQRSNDVGAMLAAQRLSQVAAQLTGKPWLIEGDNSQAQAQGVNAQWQSYWAAARSQYVTLAGAERLLAPLLHTRYAAWVSESVRSRFGVLKSGEPVLSALRRRLPVTLGLFCVGLLGGTLLGVAVGQISTALSDRAAALFRAAALLAGATWPLWCLTLGQAATDTGRLAAAGSLMLLLGGLLVVRYQGASNALQHQTGWVLAYRAIGASPLRVAWWTLRACSNLSISALAPHTSTLLTALFVIEHLLHLDGIGPLTIEALRQRELHWVMLVTAATTALVGVVHLLSDSVLRLLDPLQRHPAHTASPDA